ncbi:hypothetical protein HYQ45_009852 [Verticillium longisporum]|uniref:Uncharacterized protein n=1 Tax=Verticillium longisporum TaxID=100787 RepID=A0A8I2ZJ78_VERLO|nr:hypothetical protein HYQ45_009852 [Verticillium longisporum]
MGASSANEGMSSATRHILYASTASTPGDHHLVEQALDLPYLMNEILAYSARHLGSTRPDEASQYIFLAREYQAHALTFFNTTQVETTADNAMQMLVFSWMVGMNLLCDAACADDDATVLDEFIRYIELYRGVRVIASAAWDVLIKSNHASVFEDGRLIFMKLGTGAEAEALQGLIKDSLGMDDEQKQGNQETLARIQATYDSHSSLDAGPIDSSLPVSPSGHLSDTIGMALAWPQVVTPGFLTSLRAKRPESLFVLAHFAVIMHWCQGHWIVGRVGSRLLRSIVAALGPGWERWLQWPRDLIESTASEQSVAADQPT